MIHQSTSLLLRDHLLRVADKISGDGWRPLLDALNAHAIQANGAGQRLDEHAEEVFQATMRATVSSIAGLGATVSYVPIIEMPTVPELKPPA